ncbi:MAG: VanW family protein [Anaerolineales bacterium]
MLFVLLCLAGTVTFNLRYAGRVFPGVYIGGVDVGGLTPQEAAARLEDRITYPLQGRITLQDGEHTWVFSPQDLGLFLDAEASLQAAYRWGRRGGPAARLSEQWRAWRTGISMPPVLVFDERIAGNVLSMLAGQINQPTIEAQLEIHGLEVRAVNGQIGRQVDIPGMLEAIRPVVENLQSMAIPLAIHEMPPAVLDASQQAEVARQILSVPLVLRVPDASEGDPGPWEFAPSQLAEHLTIERIESPEGAARFQVGLATDFLRPILEEAAPQLTRKAENARFYFDDESRELVRIQDAVIGRQLLITETLQTVNEKLAAGEHDIPLVFDYGLPQVGNDAKATDLGITELVSAHTTYFYGSSAERIHNIQTAAGRFHGVMVPPGATFSMAEVLGDVSLDTGYAEALIIYGDRTIKGVGGGVCQVSTTLFRTVFFGGYPVEERHPHAYRVYYYEQNAAGGINPNLAGLDATVYVPVVDFKFKNDTPYWLLMETYVNPAARTLTWKFYSTSDGRTVEWDTTGVTNRVDPPDPVYEENPALSKGQVKQVDWAAEGADVTVTRTVYRNGEVYFSDQFTTHYMPWRAVCQYGPKTKGIPPKNPDPNHPCQPDAKK